MSVRYSEEYKRVQRAFKELRKDHEAHPEKHLWVPLQLVGDDRTPTEAGGEA